VAHNLSAKNPNITTQAILDGLKSGKSVGQTLQSLGLSEKEAKEAEASAKREAKQAEHDATRPRRPAASNSTAGTLCLERARCVSRPGRERHDLTMSPLAT